MVSVAETLKMHTPDAYQTLSLYKRCTRVLAYLLVKHRVYNMLTNSQRKINRLHE